MKIDKLLMNNVNEEYFFYSSNSSDIEREEMKKLAIEFLYCEHDNQREFLTSLIIKYVLSHHAKGGVPAFTTSVLNSFELYESYTLKSYNRKHFCHLVYTYLLGLLIYNTVIPIKSMINDTIINEGIGFDLSNKEKLKDEFLFRWRLCSLLHDIGNIVSLAENDRNLTNKYFNYLNLMSGKKIFDLDDSINNLNNLTRKKKTLVLLDKINNNHFISKLYSKLFEKPFREKGKLYHDHGIMSAMIILKLLDNMYSKYDSKAENEKIIEYNYELVSFERKYFDKSILSAMHAVAMHNICFYLEKKPDIYSKIITDPILYKLTQPFSFLLKLCDTLQEWNKPKVESGEYHKSEEVDIELTSKNIIINKFPDKKKLSDLIKSHFNHNDIIQIICDCSKNLLSQ